MLTNERGNSFPAGRCICRPRIRTPRDPELRSILQTFMTALTGRWFLVSVYELLLFYFIFSVTHSSSFIFVLVSDFLFFFTDVIICLFPSLFSLSFFSLFFTFGSHHFAFNSIFSLGFFIIVSLFWLICAFLNSYNCHSSLHPFSLSPPPLGVIALGIYPLIPFYPTRIRSTIYS